MMKQIYDGGFPSPRCLEDSNVDAHPYTFGLDVASASIDGWLRHSSPNECGEAKCENSLYVVEKAIVILFPKESKRCSKARRRS